MRSTASNVHRAALLAPRSLSSASQKCGHKYFGDQPLQKGRKEEKTDRCGFILVQG